MKISNSKKQLAKIIHENGGWRDDYDFASQDGDDYTVWFYDGRPVPGSGLWWKACGRAHRGIEGVDKLPNWHQTILSRDEYFHLYPVAKAAPEPAGKAKPTIEQLAADYRNRKDYADRKQQEADVAKADAEAKLSALVAAGKALGLVLSVADPELELVITDWRDLLPGDEIECVDGSWASWVTGRIAVVREVESADYAGGMPIRVEVDGESDWGDNFKFIRRPAKGGTNA